MAPCKTLMFLQGVFAFRLEPCVLSAAFAIQKDRPKAICNATAPKTLPQHIPRKLQRLSCTVRAQPTFASAHPAQIATTLAQCCRRTGLLCLSTSRANCNDVSFYTWRALGFASAHPAQIATPKTVWAVSAKTFASAHPAQIATRYGCTIWFGFRFASAHPAQIATVSIFSSRIFYVLCLSTSRANCNTIPGTIAL